MGMHLKVEVLWTNVVNGYEELENDGELSVAEMKNLEAMYRQDAKALSKIQMGVSKAYKYLLVRLQSKLGRLLAQATGASNFCEEKEENPFFASQSDASAKNNEWYVDSGCSNHMTRDENVFLSINNSITNKVRMENGALVDAEGKGTISINIKRSGKQIHDVLYVPEENLLSVDQLMENGYFVVFRDNDCKIYDKIESNQVIVEVEMIK
ncbi:uncharacterized protein LOC125874867 [Solanum stenotomum]|uniref:uncharacterized protein LOC125874867 n=1 Tax=Solanum stenotomum TaxID=172797 RepID=UPI0020D0F96C|nr:uncharacterized protein LOC125874867 [Solanum stenotomum]